MRGGRFARLGLFALLLAAAFVVPRALTLRAIPNAAIVEFADMADHLYFLDVVTKRRALPEQYADSFFRAFPETQPRMLAIQWPPGLYHLAALWAAPLGPGSLWTTLLTNLLFTLIMVAGTAGLGRALTRPGGSDGLRIGLWAALLVVLSPPLVAGTWYFSLDYPLLGMTTFGLWLLFETARFRRWLPVLAFGAWSALGTFIKPTYALYVLGPAALLLVQGLRVPGRRALVPVRALAGLALALGLVLALYQPDWGAMAAETRVHFVDRTLPGATTPPWTLEWALANLKFAVANYPWPLLLLAVPGLVLLHLRREARGRWFLLALLYSTYLFLTVLANKMERYIQPIYPVFCLLTVYWVVELLPRRFQTPALAAIAAAFAGMLVHGHLQRPIPWLPEPREAIPMESAYHPFRYEFHLPDRAQLARLRALRWDTECDFDPLVRQVSRWATAGPAGRPVGMIYLRDLAKMTVGHPPMPFRKLIPAVTQTVRDRFVIVANLHLMEEVPPPLLHIPSLVVIHGPELSPEQRHPELRKVDHRTVNVRCNGADYPFEVTLTRPLEPL